MKKKTTIYLDENDRRFIAEIKQKYGVTSDSDAIRLALRVTSSKKSRTTSHEEKKDETS